MSASLLATNCMPVSPPAIPHPPDSAPGPARAATGSASTEGLPPSHSVGTVAGALGGMALLGLATTLGSETFTSIAPGTVLLLASLFGATLLTAPALLALHQFLQLSARPEAMVSALAHALVSGGRVAMGVAPVGLFFAATTSQWPLFLMAGFALCGIVTAAVAVRSLRAVEAVAGSLTPRFSALLYGWAGLTTLIALRIGFDVILMTLEMSAEGGLV